MPTSASIQALSWEALNELKAPERDPSQGPSNAQARLRLFNSAESELRVTLYRDHHAWCPYCQKIWLWLEWKQIPYRISKVTMRCYGRKEDWYLRKVPSGMLPALELDGRLITESDVILLALERAFGPLGSGLEEPGIRTLRQLERLLFRAWCQWLCTPGLNPRQQRAARDQFQVMARRMEQELMAEPGPWLDPRATLTPGGVDLVFIPYVERMNASLAYYKGFKLRQEHPAIDAWLAALEQLEVYRGTQGDFHTHAHDLPPQMGGCWIDAGSNQQTLAAAVDRGDGLEGLETRWSSAEDDVEGREGLALARVIKHRERLLALNPLGPERFDQPLRAALTSMILNQDCPPEPGSARGLRYLRDRVCVPRDMPLLSARQLRQAIEHTAGLDGPEHGQPIPVRDRFDQDPLGFLSRR